MYVRFFIPLQHPRIYKIMYIIMGGEASGGADRYLYMLLNKYLPCGLNPNIITAAGLLVIIPVLLFLERRQFTIVSILLIVRCILDIMDGCVARKCHKVSEFGRKFDAFSDIVFHGTLSLYIVSHLQASNLPTWLKKYMGIAPCLSIFVLLIATGFKISNMKFLSNNTLLLYVLEACVMVVLFKKFDITPSTQSDRDAQGVSNPSGRMLSTVQG